MKRILPLFLLFVCANDLYSQAPYAWYPLDGNALDISGNNWNGTISGNPTSGTNRFGQPNKSLIFNGSTDYITLPTIFDFPTRSVMVWINANYIGNANPNFSNSAYDADNSNLQYGITNIACYLLTNEANNEAIPTLQMTCDQYGYEAAVNLNTWYHLAIVRTPSTVKFYLNGVMVYSGLNPNGAHSGNQVTYNAVVGASRDYNQNFYGNIDDLKIYNVALTDSAIFAEYNSGSYKFSDSTFIAVHDTTHITISDTTRITINDTNYVSISVTDTLFIDAKLTGISAPDNTNTLRVFPNPAKDHIYINTGDYSNMNGYIIKISNSVGQDVFSSLINQQQFYIDLNTWTSRGTYVLYIIDPSLHVIATKSIILQ